MDYVNLSEETLRTFTINIFQAIGVPEEDAGQAADVLLRSDMRGIDSHGVARLSGYVRLWEKKRINSNPNVRIVHETHSTATVDGDRGLGLVVRSEEHTSELQSLMRNSYAVFRMQKKK